MKERLPPNLLQRQIMSNSIDSPIKKGIDNTKILTGLAITTNIKHDRVPSIPCNWFNKILILIFIVEPRKEETVEKVGPGTYDPNLDAIHKKLPSITVI